jgi:signal peptidase II
VQPENGNSLTQYQEATSTKSRGFPFATILGVGALIFALDQATKYLVVTHLQYGESWSFLPQLERLFKFTFIINTGAAFGMFPQLGNVFTIIAIAVIGGIIFLHRYLPTHELWVRVSLGLQLGGALGNLLDRLHRGYVVDFVSIGFWPIFNVADLAIVVGVLVLAYYLWDEDEAQPALSPLSQGRN